MDDSLHNFSFPSSGRVSHSVSLCSHDNTRPLLGSHFLFHTPCACVTFYLSQPWTPGHGSKLTLSFFSLRTSSWHVVVLLQCVNFSEHSHYAGAVWSFLLPLCFALWTRQHCLPSPWLQNPRGSCNAQQKVPSSGKPSLNERKMDCLSICVFLYTVDKNSN